ncbi:MAG TPA: bifunctional adenosylcobinamide kinase/adenosylcobinamide-phosphate guanylyltransferase [Actinomycetota bacterium]
MLTVLLGGARGGKSSHAVRLATATGAPVTVIATAEARDDEMRARIASHRSGRPKEWETIEEPLDLTGALAKPADGATVIVDCLTLWVSNLMEAGADDQAVEQRARAAASQAAARDGDTIVVSNEVGFGIVPADPMTRRYRDLLGRVNTIWCEHAESALLLVAGRALRLEALR